MLAITYDKSCSDSSNLLSGAVSEMGRRSSYGLRWVWFRYRNYISCLQLVSHYTRHIIYLLTYMHSIYDGSKPLLKDALKVTHRVGNGKGKFFTRPVRDFIRPRRIVRFNTWQKLNTSPVTWIKYSLGTSMASGVETSECGAKSLCTCNYALLLSKYIWTQQCDW